MLRHDYIDDLIATVPRILSMILICNIITIKQELQTMVMNIRRPKPTWAGQLTGIKRTFFFWFLYKVFDETFTIV